MGQRYRKIENQKLWPSFTCNKDFAKGKGLETKAKKWKCLNLKACVSKPV